MTGMQIVRIWRRDDDGPIEQLAVKAGPTPVPGLVVNEDPRLSGTWNITHAASGAAVACKFDSPEHALHVALKLAGVCDWTMSREEITEARYDLRERWAQALEDAGALEMQPWRQSVPDSYLSGGGAA